MIRLELIGLDNHSTMVPFCKFHGVHNPENTAVEVDAVGINQEEALATLIAAEYAENENLETTGGKFEEYFTGFMLDVMDELNSEMEYFDQLDTSEHSTLLMQELCLIT